MALSSNDIERHIRRVVSPSNPLRRMTTRELIQEQEWLEHLADQGERANLDAFLDASEAFQADLAMARRDGRCVANIRPRFPQECIVVDSTLSAQLDLRLRLCRNELTHRRRVERSVGRAGSRLRMH